MAQAYPAHPQRRASSAFLWGILFGALVVALDLLNRGFLTRLLARALHSGRGAVGRDLGVAALLSAAVFIVGLVCYFLAGLLAARRSRTFEAGVSAGLIAGALVAIYRIVIAVIAAGRVSGGTGAGRASGALVAGVTAAFLVGLLGGIAIATGVAALGALLGRGRANDGMPPQQYRPYQPAQPAPGTPGQGYAAPAQTLTPTPSGARDFVGQATSYPSYSSYPPADNYAGPEPQSYPSRGNDDPTIQTGIVQQDR